MTMALMGVALAGCGADGQGNQARTLALGHDESGRCLTIIAQDPRYAPIAAHTPLGDAPASEYQLWDSGRPAPALRPVVAAWRSDLWRCRAVTLATAADAAPDATLPLRQSYLASDDVLGALAAGRITWGEANRQRDAIAASNGAMFEGAIASQSEAIAAAEDEVYGPVLQGFAELGLSMLYIFAEAIPEPEYYGSWSRGWHGGVWHHGAGAHASWTHTAFVRGAGAARERPTHGNTR
jgi:hypothetical protein